MARVDISIFPFVRSVIRYADRMEILITEERLLADVHVPALRSREN